MKNILIVILILGAAGMWACSKDLPDAGGTATEALSNEWWATDNGAVVRKITTYNTSANEDSMWISTTKAPNAFLVKVKIDPSSLTFSVQNSKNFTSNLISTVNITNGKVIPKGGKSQTGNITDSIYMEAEFSNAPGVKHIFSGVARTRFEADDY
ncbi:lipid-binding protein [Niastella sp. OAS944]|uniref:lipid-binding protein n=1 Tax=Niastella sp. OAS944 TaxID=2664089 RepID=UPI003474A892|nr:hypothetical protein [Chitinophagaceae bacterium OAS944]